MKTIWLFSLLLMSAAQAYTCPTPVNTAKVVLFIDLNNSALEVAAAERATCTRGEAFRRVPDRNVYLDRAALGGYLAGLAQQNRAVTSIVISGHDGGGIYKSQYGEIKREDIITSMHNAYVDKPELSAQWRSVFLWGCYSTVPGEITAWRDSVPSLRMTAGSLERGPSNLTAQSRTVLRDLLAKENDLVINSANMERVRSLLSSVENINRNSFAVYLAQCGGDGLFSYRTDGSNDDGTPLMTAGNHLVQFNASFACSNLNQSQVESKLPRIMEFYQGSRPIPTDTSRGELRRLYAFARIYSHCLSDRPAFNADRLIMLTYFEEVKRNFARVFAREIADAGREFTHLANYFNALHTNNPELLALQRNWRLSRADIFEPNAGRLRTQNRASIRRMINRLEGILAEPAVASVPANAANFAHLRRLRSIMDTYLYTLDPNCMNYLDWHEVTPRVPVPACPY